MQLRNHDGRRNRNKFTPSVVGLESLETRNLLSGIATDYVLQVKWASPAVTYSFMPDGTNMQGHVNTLNATMQAKVGPGWRDEIGRALQTWAAASGLTMREVADDGKPEGADGKPQSDPSFGDIRIGGYDFGNQTILAQTYGPSNGTTIGGDLSFNTSFSWSIGSRGSGDIDLYSVALHESGHAIGLGHASDPGDVMYPQYTGVVTGLGLGDIAGDQALYGPPEGGTAPPVLPAPVPPVVVKPPVVTPAPTPIPPVVVNPAPTPTPPPATPVPPVVAPTPPRVSPTPPVVVKPMTPAQRRAAARAAQQQARAARRQAQQQARAARQEAARQARIARQATQLARQQARAAAAHPWVARSGATRHGGFTVTYQR